MNLICVPPDRAGAAWPLVHPYIERAIKRTDISDIMTVKSDVVSGHSLLWVAIDENERLIGAGVTQLVLGDNRKICEIVAWGADDQQKCAPLLNIIHEHAKDEGCQAVRLFGRKGWARMLKEYKIRALVMEKVL